MGSLAAGIVSNVVKILFNKFTQAKQKFTLVIKVVTVRQRLPLTWRSLSTENLSSAKKIDSESLQVRLFICFSTMCITLNGSYCSSDLITKSSNIILIYQRENHWFDDQSHYNSDSSFDPSDSDWEPASPSYSRVSSNQQHHHHHHHFHCDKINTMTMIIDHHHIFLSILGIGIKAYETQVTREETQETTVRRVLGQTEI